MFATHAPDTGALAIVRAIGVQRLKHAAGGIDAADLARFEHAAYGAGNTCGGGWHSALLIVSMDSVRDLWRHCSTDRSVWRPFRRFGPASDRQGGDQVAAIRVVLTASDVQEKSVETCFDDRTYGEFCTAMR